MMFCRLVVAFVFAVLILFTAVLPVVAESQPFYAMVGTHTPAAEGPVWVRYYTSASRNVNPGGQGNCYGTWDPPYCEIPHTDKPEKGKVGYRGYLEDIFNFGTPEGKVYHAIWDTEFAPGTGEHRGYYAWSAREVWVSDTSTAWNPGCAGDTQTTTCLGNSDPDTAAGHEVEFTGIGTLEPWGGLMPIPVPYGSNAGGGVIHVQWEEASGTGLAGQDPWTAEYDLYYVVTGNTCALPTTEGLQFLKHVEGTETDITNEEVGIPEDSRDRFFLVLKIVFPSANGRKMETRYFSANSSCFQFWGDAAEIVNLRARWLRRNLVEVSWETQLEEHVRGFRVLRGFTEKGPWELVSDLLPAHGEPSKYTFFDEVRPTGPVAGSGLYYEVEAVEFDETAIDFGPVEAEAPVSGGPGRLAVGPGDGP